MASVSMLAPFAFLISSLIAAVRRRLPDDPAAGNRTIVRPGSTLVRFVLHLRTVQASGPAGGRGTQIDCQKGNACGSALISMPGRQIEGVRRLFCTESASCDPRYWSTHELLEAISQGELSLGSLNSVSIIKNFRKVSTRVVSLQPWPQDPWHQPRRDSRKKAGEMSAPCQRELRARGHADPPLRVNRIENSNVFAMA